MKGLFIPGITTEMFMNGCLESIETLMAEGEIYDIDYPLEQEPCEDCISRQAVLDVIRGCRCEEWIKADIGAPIEALSPVTPAEKVGHWTIKQYQVPIENKRVPTISDITFLPIEPTACKTVYTYTHSACKSEEYLNKHNYCPNCGCKMESEVDE